VSLRRDRRLWHRFGQWLRDGALNEHPAVAAALAHLELVAIHPFYDGNGRTARALSRLLLVHHGLALDGLVSLDAYLDLQRRDYFAAVRASLGTSYARGYDATPFVTYYLRAIVGAAEHVLSRVKGTTELLRILRDGVAKDVLLPQLTDGLVYAWINGTIRPSDYRTITGRTGPSATRDRPCPAGRLPHRQRRDVIAPLHGRPQAPSGAARRSDLAHCRRRHQVGILTSFPGPPR